MERGVICVCGIEHGYLFPYEVGVPGWLVKLMWSMYFIIEAGEIICLVASIRPSVRPFVFMSVC